MQLMDEKILLFIQESLRCDQLTAVMRLFTKLGDAGIIWIIIGLGLLCFAAARKKGVVYLSALAGTAIVNNLVL